MKYAVLLVLLVAVILPIGTMQALLDTLPTIQPSTPAQTTVTIGNVSGNTVAVPTPTITIGSGDLLEQIVNVARSWLNPPVPYVWGGCSHKGIDCSCFVLNVYAAFNIHVGRTTVVQQAQDTPIARSQLRTGDTLFFNNTCTNCGANPTHEGLYIGNGLMIDAGDPVQIEPINSPYWIAHYASAGRPAGL